MCCSVAEEPLSGSDSVDDNSDDSLTKCSSTSAIKFGSDVDVDDK